ncbi:MULTISPECIES: F0F1 ATP synthase subunit epsilon [Mycobacteriaceae]|uniref:ATP synthase epsilon chain n=4 Tax=Mycobacteriaceae TaxID=1762 RepID=A0A7I9Y6G8_MYCAL|nr:MULTISPECIES: F0F1 ATP synthase subunit epsilon [Mycobacteriaceae]OQZ95653.1 F0F1 ATP synthase subunit epsilon [Mycolicibacter algericus DSM 45454]RRR44293.1 F0F1 ATP synthase subunit epsilon [Mycolicibacter terrae]BBX11466.1 ATP synthase epsilon chain [Mycobacterium novum]GFG84276.1 ATP synthase epsilon chain [Mycolicibacter algericus]
MAEIDVDIVAVDRKVWSGKATFIFTRTTVGEIGIYPRHIPLVAELVDDAMVRVDRVEEGELRLAVHGGFLSVTDEGVSILAESVDFAAEIDEATARHDANSNDPKLAAQGRARLRALGVID